MTHAAIPIVSLLMFAVPAVVGATTYSIDPDRSQLVVRLYKAGLASGMAHNHVVEATDYEGTVSWNPEEPATAEVQVSVDARSLVVDEEALRKEYELEKPMPDDKRREVQSTMESEDQLGVQQYPSMSFRSTAVEPTGDGSIVITGELSLHGAIRSVSFTTTPSVQQGTLRANAQLDLLQSDFGIEPYSAFLGMVKNKDDFKLIIHLVAVAQESSEAPAEESPQQ